LKSPAKQGADFLDGVQSHITARTWKDLIYQSELMEKDEVFTYGHPVPRSLKIRSALSLHTASSRNMPVQAMMS